MRKYSTDLERNLQITHLIKDLYSKVYIQNSIIRKQTVGNRLVKKYFIKEDILMADNQMKRSSITLN